MEEYLETAMDSYSVCVTICPTGEDQQYDTFLPASKITLQ
jgi:hypothetical protein